ncbi:hypothetical protein [Streptomyces fulvoviolaceus]|nr:hypothetical protein [Streptomyces fulvoviolaceus]
MLSSFVRGVHRQVAGRYDAVALAPHLGLVEQFEAAEPPAG